MLDMFLEPPCELDEDEVQERDEESAYWAYIDSQEHESEIYWSAI